MWAKFGIAVVATALLTAVYAAENRGGHGGGAHAGGGAHFGVTHFGGTHFGGFGRGDIHFHGVRGVEAREHGGHGGDEKERGGHGGEAHNHGGHGSRHAGVAGALRYPLYWLSWPFAYYSTPDLAETCGEDSSDIAGVPIGQYQQAIQSPTDEQRAALDELANAATKAAQDIAGACPADLALTAPGRLAAMQQRLEAMITAVATVQPALEKFYGFLSDEQKARVNLLVRDQPQGQTPEEASGALAQNCGAAQLNGMGLPNAEIDRAVHPSDAQRTDLIALQNATTQAAADLLKASCVADNPLTPAAKLSAVGKRLDAMLQALKTVSAALNNFYGMLSDEQKARFEAIGPQLASQPESEPQAAPATHTTVRRYDAPPVGQIIRHFLPF
jgi:hypothetical protein